MKYLLNISCTLLFSITFLQGTFSQQKQGEALIPKDEKAKSILNELSSKTKALKSIQVSFNYHLQNLQEGIDETQDGKLTVMGESKYLLEIVGQKIYCDGKTIWTYAEDADEVTVDNVPEENDKNSFMNPSTLFHAYEKGFKYVYEGESKIENSTAHVIKLFPMEPEGKMYHTIVLYIMKNENYIKKAVVKGKDGNTYTYEIKSYQENVPVSEKDFSFDTAKVGEVIDLRE